MAEGDLRVLNVPGWTVGTIETDTPGVNALLSVDASDLDGRDIRVLNLPGGTLGVAETDHTGYYGIVTMSLDNAEGRTWRVLNVSNTTVTVVDTDTAGVCALLIVDATDADPADYRVLNVSGTTITLVETGIPGYRAMLTVSMDDYTDEAVRVLNVPGGTAAAVATETPGAFALLGEAWGAGGAPDDPPPVFTYQDEFSVTEAAVMASPHTADILGTAAILDTTSKMSVAGGLLLTNGGNAINDPQLYDAIRTNSPGRFMYVRQQIRDTFTGGGYFGLSSVINANQPNPVAWVDAFNQVNPTRGFTAFDGGLSNGGVVNASYNSVPLYLESLVISTNPGAIWLQRHVDGDWMVVFADEDATATNVYARLTSLSKKFYVERIEAGSMANDTRFANFHAFATAYTTTTSDGSTATSESNALIKHRITASTGVTQELMVRRVDDNNCWIVRMSQAGSTVKLIEKVAGVETERATAAQTWTNATAYKITVTMDGRNIRVAVNTVHKIAYTVATALITATGVKVSHAGADLVAYPRRLRRTGFTSRLRHAFLPYGDSKTLGQEDETPEPNGDKGFAPHLTALLPAGWGETLRIARSGYTVAQMRALVDADLAARFDAPEYILCNLGANDVASMPVQATFESNYGYILDAMHTRFPDARIYLMRPWRETFSSSCNTLATWIGNVVSARSAFAFLGPDERVFLENGDDGATYTFDGIHPNHAGYVLTAQQWHAVLGL